MDYSQLKTGDFVEFKKPHPSKTKTWELVRIGAKYKFRSTSNPDLLIEVDRQTLKYNLKKIY